MQLSIRDNVRLMDVHPDLVAIVRAAAGFSTINFIVTEGVRSKERQAQLVASGKSQTMNSRHLTGHAVDLAVWFDQDSDKVVDVGELSWRFPHYQLLAAAVKTAAKTLGTPIEWGGDWKSFVDGPHFQLPFAQYPK